MRENCKISLTIFTLFIAIFGSGQNVKNRIDFKVLDSIIINVKILGAGESTHGTSEFTTFRFDLFKYLVEKHNFNTFFLEADFSACQRVNRYIHGQNDTLENAIQEILLWPWLTQEMIEIIQWCHEYNKTNFNVINFIGCDMQLINDDYIEFKRVFEKETNKQTLIDSIFLHLKYNSPDSLIKLGENRWFDFKESIKKDTNFFTQIQEFELMSVTIEQWFKDKLSHGNNYNFRDSCMSSNMIKYMDLHPTTKALYFAHNWHVSNTFHTNFHSTRTTGAFLKEKIYNQYFSLALLSSEPPFNAITCINGSNKMAQFIHHTNKRRDLEQLFAEKNTNFIILSDNIDHLNKYFMTDIGATYGKDCDGYKSVTRRKLKKELFDGFMYVKSSKATQLIEVIKKKYS